MLTERKVNAHELAKALHEAGYRGLSWNEIGDKARDGRRTEAEAILEKFNVTEKQPGA